MTTLVIPFTLPHTGISNCASGIDRPTDRPAGRLTREPTIAPSVRYTALPLDTTIPLLLPEIARVAQKGERNNPRAPFVAH